MTGSDTEGEAKHAPRLRPHLAALLLYFAVWLIAALPSVAGEFGGRVLSSAPMEVSIFVWSFEWWPHAIGEGANPLYPRLVWAPTGVNLAWVTTLPGASVLLAPLVHAFGPIVSFNVLALAIPPVTAWGAFVLARHLTKAWWPAVAGGFLFGFSPYVMREIRTGHPNLSLVFLLPLAAYLVVLRVEGGIGRRAFVGSLTALLVAQFLIFIEIVATMAVVGAVLAVLALLLSPPDLRSKILDTLLLVGVSFALASVVLSPYLFAAFAYPDAYKPGEFKGLATGARDWGDLIRFLLPSRLQLLTPPTPVYGERDYNFWYIGVPLLVVLVVSAVSGRHRMAERLLGLGLLASSLLALGSRLQAFGLVPLPWAVLGSLPLLERARPGRIIAYAFLFAALSASLWVSRAPDGWRKGLRWGLVVLAAASFLPRVTHEWTTPVRYPSFFEAGLYREHVRRGEVVMIVSPRREVPVLWQAKAGFHFRLLTFYPGFRPADHEDPALALDLSHGRRLEEPSIRGFLSRHRVTAVIVDRRVPARITARLASVLDGEASRVGDITLIRPSPLRAPRREQGGARALA